MNGDGLSGAAGAKVGRNIRAHLSKSAAQKNLVGAFEEAGVKDPRQAARLSMETAMAGEEVQAGLDKNVNGCTTKVVDTANCKSGVGHSGRIQAEIRVKETPSLSKTAVRRANTYSTPSHLQETFPEVRPVESRSIPQNACAEHQAFDIYNNNTGYNVNNTRTSTVYTAQGNFSTIARCSNCFLYGSKMGYVVTDHIPHEIPVSAEPYIAAGSTIGAYTTLGGAALLQKKSRRQ